MANSPNSAPKNSTRLIYFGTDELSPIVLGRLLESGWPVTAVVTKPDAIKGRNKETTEPAVKQIAKTHHIPVFQPARLQDIEDKLRVLKPEIGVLVAYGKIVPESTIGLFPKGIINVHPSLLPEYRGSSPIEQAILHGDAKTGVSIMQLAKEMDAGPVYASKEVPLRNDDSQTSFYPKLGLIGSELLLEVLPGILSGTLVPRPQDSSKATYAPLLSKENGYIDWDKESADAILRKIRAFDRWPQARGTIVLPNSQPVEVIITKAEPANTTHQKPGHVYYLDGKLVVAAKSGAVELLVLKVPGKNTMSGAQFAAGYLK